MQYYYFKGEFECIPAYSFYFLPYTHFIISALIVPTIQYPLRKKYVTFHGKEGVQAYPVSGSICI